MTCTSACVHPSPGTRQMHCGSCHITFGGLRGFDAHRHRGACRTPAELGMADNGRGVWRVPVGAGERWWPR